MWWKPKTKPKTKPEQKRCASKRIFNFYLCAPERICRPTGDGPRGQTPLCREGESNSQGLPHQLLGLARLPISPSRQILADTYAPDFICKIDSRLCRGSSIQSGNPRFSNPDQSREENRDSFATGAFFLNIIRFLSHF